jgi:hypothetical protein
MKASPLAHEWTGPQLVESIQQQPFPSSKWEAARTTKLDPALVPAFKAALLRAHFSLVPPALLNSETFGRPFLDEVAKARYGVSLTEDLGPQCIPRERLRLKDTCPALVLTLPTRERELLEVRPGFLQELGALKYFWNGNAYVCLNDPRLSTFTFWKTA